MNFVPTAQLAHFMVLTEQKDRQNSTVRAVQHKHNVQLRLKALCEINDKNVLVVYCENLQFKDVQMRAADQQTLHDSTTYIPSAMKKTTLFPVCST